MSTAVSRMSSSAKLTTISGAPTPLPVRLNHVIDDKVASHPRPIPSTRKAHDTMSTDPFAVRFDMAITERALSEDEVARLLGVSQATVNRWRTGRLIPSHESAPAVARFLRVARGELEAMLDRTHDSHDMVERGTFGHLLRELEGQRGLTPIEMIDRYGVERSRYYRWRGNLTVPKPETIAALAAQLEVKEERIVLACYRTQIRR